MSVLSFVALDFFLISDRTGNLQTPTCQCFLTFWRLHDESKIINGLIYNKDNPELQPQTINSYCIFILERKVANTQFTAELQRTFNNLTIWNLELLKCLCLVEHSSQTFFVIMPFVFVRHHAIQLDFISRKRSKWSMGQCWKCHITCMCF